MTLADLFADLEKDISEEIPLAPVFNNSQEDSTEEEDDFSEEDLDELANLIDTLDTELETAKSETKTKEEELESINVELSEAIQIIETIEEAWQKVLSHPILGKYATDIVQ